MDNTTSSGSGSGSSGSSMADSEAQHEFGALNTLLLVVVIGLCIMCAYIIKVKKIYYLPESAMAMLVGVVVGGLARIFYPSKEELDFLTFDPEMFFFVLLPPIIFEAGYSLKRKRFFANFSTIILFAVMGTLVSTFVVGSLTYWIGKAGWIEIDTSDPIEALLFGALISAVDPVATLSIMGNAELNCNQLLYSLVFGESVLNDAVAIVLFRTFQRYYEFGVDGTRTFNKGTIPLVMLEFIGISAGSLCLGVMIGLACSYIFKNTRISEFPKYEMSLLFLFAYGSYAFAECVGMSGIFALFFTGIIMAHYNSYNLSATSQVTAHSIFESLATVAEFFVFLYMGMSFFTGRLTRWSGLFIFMAILFCLFARACNIFPFSFLANCKRKEEIPRNMQIILWFAGLRGAIAFALSQNMPGPNAELYATTTLSIVIFTTVVCGGLTQPMLVRYGMQSPAGEADSDRQEHTPLVPMGDDDDDGGMPDREMAAYDSPEVAQLSDHHGQAAVMTRRPSFMMKSGIHSWWKRMDAQWMKPLFGGKPPAHQRLGQQLAVGKPGLSRVDNGGRNGRNSRRQHTQNYTPPQQHGMDDDDSGL